VRNLALGLLVVGPFVGACMPRRVLTRRYARPTKRFEVPKDDEIPDSEVAQYRKSRGASVANA